MYMRKNSVRTTPAKKMSVLLAVLLSLMLVAGLFVGVLMVQRSQNVASDASVAGGLASVAFDNTVTQAEIGKPTSVRVSLNTKGALIDAAQLGIRFKGVAVNNVTFTASQTQLVLSQSMVNPADAQSGIDVVLTSSTNQPVQLMDSIVIGMLTFTPQSEGQLELLFDPAFSKVTSRQTKMSPPSPQPVQVISETTPAAETAPGPSSQPTVGVIAIRDILQTPTGITLQVRSTTQKTPVPSPRPEARIYCETDSQCPSGTYCARPPTTCLPGNPSVCTSERPYCIPRPSPRPVTSPAPYQDADLNRDRAVNVLDLSILISQLLKRGDNQADLNDDGIVDITDYSTMLMYLR